MGYLYVHYYGIRNRDSRKLLYKVLIFNIIIWVQYFLTYTWGLKSGILKMIHGNYRISSHIRGG